MRINVYDLCRKVAITFIVVYFYFYQFFEAFGIKNVALAFLGLAIILILAVKLMMGKIRTVPLRYMGWIYFFMVLLFHNQYVKVGNYGSVLMPIAVLFVVLFFGDDDRWVEYANRLLIRLGLVHVFATLIFAVSNELYLAIMPQIWGYYPVGTSSGTYGAAAALTRHYSYNGIYCTAVFLLLASLLITKNVKPNVYKKHLVLTLFSFIAVVLTQKRAHLIFSIAALIGLYLLCGSYKGLTKTLRVIFWGTLAVICFAIASLFVPAFSNIISRFFVSGDADISTGRFGAWQAAWDMFLENKMFGNGWFYFPIEYNRTEFPEVHNIYIQYLCELGIVGAIIMITTMIVSIIVCIFTYKKAIHINENKWTAGLSISIAVQIFVMLYGITGCCMTDITVMVYLLSVAAGFAITNRVRITNIEKR